jgi:hypothetical protein
MEVAEVKALQEIQQVVVQEVVELLLVTYPLCQVVVTLDQVDQQEVEVSLRLSAEVAEVEVVVLVMEVAAAELRLLLLLSVGLITPQV